MRVEMRKGAALIAALASAFAISGCGSPECTDVEASETIFTTLSSEALWAYDIHNQRELAGAKDSIFVGTVEEQVGTRELETSMEGRTTPTTQFRVSVFESLKGEFPSEVIVNQQAGYDPVTRVLRTFGNDPLLEAGVTYIFSAKYIVADNYYWIVPEVGSESLSAADAETMTSNPQSRGAFKDEPQAVREMRESIANGIPYRGKVVPGSTPVAGVSKSPSSSVPSSASVTTSEVAGSSSTVSHLTPVTSPRTTSEVPVPR
ncbi:hypothetical protein [Rhodococcus sp. IEGM 1379]|uniref:hypothetical protein n=1 Tax=Rhodococcus sp. IEGM 1379 TaxID=3047086 RepID=UPI0024B82B0C|nr:hypothetical protein [Rhodococcus sp. IEGM 1379]MDI9918875.1 hypothetical protein [Rhodococcus sp. IEGM 1379]